MKAVFALCALVAAATSAAVNASWCVDSTGTPTAIGTCYITQSAPTAQSNNFCTEFAAQSCCEPVTIEQMVKAEILRKNPQIFGNGNCMNNVRQMLCGASCWSCKSNHLVSAAQSITNITIYLSTAFAQGLWDSCRDICISPAVGAAPALVSDIFPTPAKFLAAFYTDNDISYIPDSAHPRVTYVIGTSPEGGSYNGPTLPAGPADDVPCDGECNGGGPWLNRTHVFCTEYDVDGGESCCLEYKEQALKEQVSAKMPPVVGVDGCYKNMKKLFCGSLCGPNNADIAHFTAPDPITGIRNMTLYITPETGAGIWASCKGHPFRLAGCRTFDKMWNNPDEFLANFASDADPTYVPNVMTHNTRFKVGTHPLTGHAWNFTAFPAAGEDITGCAVPHGSSSSIPDDGAATILASQAIGSIISALAQLF